MSHRIITAGASQLAGIVSRRVVVASPSMRGLWALAWCAAATTALAPVRRRALLGGVGAAVAAPALSLPWAARAASPEITRLKAGYDGIEYLLGAWEKETVIKCGQAGQVTLASECDRDTNKVPAALGLKTTDHPLFKVEKLFKAAILADDGGLDIDAWNGATEAFIQHSTSAQEYAYTASFAEYNPSGGKDQVAKYMDLSKEELGLARDALKDVLTQLGIKV